MEMNYVLTHSSRRRVDTDSPVEVAKLSRNARRLRDSGHNHQGVNSLADRKSLLKQTEGLGSQSSSEDFSFEPGTSSPWLRANLTDRPLNLPTLTELGEHCPPSGKRLANK